MKDQISQIEREALQEIGSASNDKSVIESLRVKYLGRKGIVTELFKKMGSLPAAEKAETGRLLNILKEGVTRALEAKLEASSGDEGEAGEGIDITLPGIMSGIGRCHPITGTIRRICEIFISMGFRVVEGPEVETEYYNFEALNIPLEHPSRDAFDTFYLKPIDQSPLLRSSSSGGQAQSKAHLLRSHTSPVQARFMEENKPPFSIIVPGRVFRPDATDASHSFMFHQVEGLVVGKGIKFSDLKGVLELFAKEMFGKSTKMRFRPSFFPFTEPSAEVDISCVICANASHERRTTPHHSLRSGSRHANDERRRCSVCGGKGWLEILGAGMVNPKVFNNVGYDPEKVTGFAFGMGVERIAMLKHGITDIRLFFENDVRFLKQF